MRKHGFMQFIILTSFALINPRERGRRFDEIRGNRTHAHTYSQSHFVWMRLQTNKPHAINPVRITWPTLILDTRLIPSWVPSVYAVTLSSHLCPLLIRAEQTNTRTHRLKAFFHLIPTHVTHKSRGVVVVVVLHMARKLCAQPSLLSPSLLSPSSSRLARL